MFSDPTIIFLFLSGLAYLVLSAAVVWKHGFQPRIALLLAVYGLAALGWVVVQLLLRLQQLNLVRGFDGFTLERIALYFLVAQGVIFYQLTRRFTRRKSSGLPGWIAGGVLMALALLVYENPLGWPDRLALPNGASLARELAGFLVIVLTWGGFMAGALALTIRNLRGRVSPLHRNRTTYWLLAVSLVLAGQALALFRLPSPGSLLQVLALVTAVYAQVTYNLPDLRVAGRHAVSFSVIAAITALFYTAGYLLVQAIAVTNPGFHPVLAGVILAVVLILLLNPLLNIIQRYIRRLIDRSRYDPRQMVGEYSMSISNILDMELLSAIVIGLITGEMEITHGALLSVEYEPGSDPDQEDSGAFRVCSNGGPDQDLPEGRLSAANPAAHFLRREHRPLTQYDIDLLPRFHTMEASERSWLSSLDMDVYVPIYTKDSWIGLLVLGPKKSGDRYFQEDLDLLQTLADQTAVALENARLYEHLKQRNAENERLNEELKTANVELARLDSAKSDFINIASHELRTPLTQVIGYNDVLGEMLHSNEVQPEIGVQMVNSVRKAARRLEEIVETMFDVSKLESNTLDLVPATVSMAAVISVAIDTWTKGINERGLSITVRGVANLPPIIADGKRLTQVFSQLIQNAIKSTPDGGQIRVTGRVAETDENGSPKCIEVVIADTGIGIDAAELERIFEKFYRVGNILLHSTGDIKFMGAGPGLGLTIARGIIEAHGGQIWAESPGYDEETCPGARFHVRLPVRPPEAPILFLDSDREDTGN